MPDFASILTTTGVIVDVDFSTTNGASGNIGGFRAVTLLPGAAVQVRGMGEHLLDAGPITGRQGFLQVSFQTGSTGSTRTLAAFVGTTGQILGLALDAFNRPLAYITDRYGTVAAQSYPSGVHVPSATGGRVTLIWDAVAGTADMRTDFGSGGVFASSWSTVVPWEHFRPTSLLVGVGIAASSWGNATGSVLHVQAGAVPVALPAATAILSDAPLVAEASLTASIRGHYQISANLLAHATVAASLTLNPGP